MPIEYSNIDIDGKTHYYVDSDIDTYRIVWKDDLTLKNYLWSSGETGTIYNLFAANTEQEIHDKIAELSINTTDWKDEHTDENGNSTHEQGLMLP